MAINVTTLDNGLRVATDSMDTVESVSIGVWVDVGTRHEKTEMNGVSHLLEHMAFKGTKRRTALQIAEQIEDVGGHINAYTSRENTAYYARVLKEDQGLALDIIADIIQHSTMDSKEFELERAVILQEINSAEDTPDDVIFDHFQRAAYPDQPLGRPVLGLAQVVGEMSRQTVIDYMSSHYHAPGMVLTAAGRCEHDQVVALASEFFTKLGRGTPPMRQKASYAGGESREIKDLEQAHLLLGFDGMAFDDPDFYAMAVFSTLFGGGMSSRLFQEIREKRGLVYSIYSFASSYLDGGTFGIYAGTGEQELAQLTPLICQEIKKVQERVNDAEVARSKAQLKASILMSLESSSSRCEQLARQLLVFRRPLSVEEVVNRIEAVDTAAIVRVARRIFATAPTLASLGPVSKLADFDRIKDQLA